MYALLVSLEWLTGVPVGGPLTFILSTFLESFFFGGLILVNTWSRFHLMVQVNNVQVKECFQSLVYSVKLIWKVWYKGSKPL